MPATFCNGCNIITKSSSSDSSGALRRKYKRLPFTWLKRKFNLLDRYYNFFAISLSLRLQAKQERENKEKKSSRISVDFDISGFTDPFARYDTLRNTRLPLPAAFSCVTNLSSFLLAGERKMMSPIGREVDRGGGTMTGSRQGQQRPRADCSELLHKRVSKYDGRVALTPRCERAPRLE